MSFQRSAEHRQSGSAFADELHELVGIVGAQGFPGSGAQLQQRWGHGTALGPQPGQYIRCQLADADKALNARYGVYSDQFYAGP